MIPYFLKTANHLAKVNRKLRIIIHNLFAFLHLIHKICLKKGKFCLKKGLLANTLKSDSQSSRSDSQYPKNLAHHLAKVIRNYPKKVIRIWRCDIVYFQPCTYIHIYIYTYIYTYIRTYITTYTHRGLLIYIHKYIHKHMYIHTYINAYMHPYICIHIHIHIQVYMLHTENDYKYAYIKNVFTY